MTFQKQFGPLFLCNNNQSEAAPQSTIKNLNKKRQKNGEGSEGQGQGLPHRVNNADVRTAVISTGTAQCVARNSRRQKSGGNDSGDGTTANNAATTGTVTQTGQDWGDAAKECLAMPICGVPLTTKHICNSGE